MKKFLFSLLLFVCGTAFAGDYKGVQITIENCPTSAMAQVTFDTPRMTGKVLAYSAWIKTNDVAVSASHTVTVAVASIADTGSTLGPAKTVWTSYPLQAALSSNMVGTVYLYEDKLQVTVTNATTAGVDIGLFFILEE